MATFGGTKKHRVEDSKGNTLTKQTIEFYPTQADAQAGTNVIGTTKIDVEGDWTFDTSYGEVWCKIQDYGIWKETDLSSTFAPLGLLSIRRPVPPPVASLVTNFGAGHGWTIFNNSAASFTDDTATYALGGQSVKVVTKGDGVGAQIEKSGLTIDATGKGFKVWVRLQNAAACTNLIVTIGDATFANYYVWTIQDDLTDAQRLVKEGEWVCLTLGMASAAVTGTPPRSALTRIRLRAGDQSGNPVTAWWGGIATYTEPTTYPNGVVSFAFDDTYISQFSEGRKALDKYGWGGTAYTIADKVGQSGFMSSDQLRALEGSNGWEVAGHAYTSTNHGLGFSNISTAALDVELKNLRLWLQDNGFKGGDHMAYPLGAFSGASEAVVGKYFATARTIASRMPNETQRPGLPLRIRSLSLTNSTAVSTVTNAIDKAFTYQGWLVITVHDLQATANLGTQYSIANFQSIVDYCATKGIPVRTVGEVIKTAA